MEFGHRNTYTPNMWKDYLATINEENVAESEYIDDIRKKMREFTSNNLDNLNISFEQFAFANTFHFFEENYILINSNDIYNELTRCQILILTANNVEKVILHTNILNESREKIKRIIRDNSVYYIFKWGKYWICHVHQTETGAKDLGAGVALREAIKYFHPNVIFSLGVSFGIDHKNQNIGDVIVSHRILPYDNNKLDNDKLKPDRSQDKTIDKWLNVRLINSNMFIDSVTYGDVLSGGSVLSSYTEKKKICSGYTTSDYIIGGEMEGNSIFQFTNTEGIPSVVIKGICDWGVIKNSLLSEDFKNGFREEQLEIMESEETYKTALQAYAMNCVCEKVAILLRDSQLFAVPKEYTEQKYIRQHKKDLACLRILSIYILVYVFVWCTIHIILDANSFSREYLIKQLFIIEVFAIFFLLCSALIAAFYSLRKDINLPVGKEKALKGKKKYKDLGNGYAEEE